MILIYTRKYTAHGNLHTDSGVISEIQRASILRQILGPSPRHPNVEVPPPMGEARTDIMVQLDRKSLKLFQVFYLIQMKNYSDFSE